MVVRRLPERTGGFFDDAQGRGRLRGVGEDGFIEDGGIDGERRGRGTKVPDGLEGDGGGGRVKGFRIRVNGSADA